MEQHSHLPGHHNLPPSVPGPLQYSTLGYTSRRRRSLEQSHRSRSRSPNTNRSGRSSPQSPQAKKSHLLSDSESDTERHMDINSKVDFPDLTASYSFILTQFDPKYQNTKQLFQQFTKYVSRDTITRLIPTRNGVIIQTPDSNFANKIRNRHTFEIFGKSANITRLESRSKKQTPPPRNTPSLSVVIRGVDLDISDDEAEAELKAEGHTITKCLRIKNKEGGPTYMIRVLTGKQDTIDDLLSNGAYIYRKRHRVEPSHSPPPIPVRCEKCQMYNAHHTFQCRNEVKCGYCTGPHSTRSCTNMQQPPKCTLINESRM